MSGNEIVSAISLQLKEDIPEVPRRYKESQNQNIVRPCFFIKEIANPVAKQMFKRFQRNPRYRITFLPLEDSSSIEADCRAIGEKLLESFYILRLPKGLKAFGREMEYEIVNNELLFTMEVPMSVILSTPSEPEAPKVQKVTVIKNVKG